MFLQETIVLSQNSDPVKYLCQKSKRLGKVIEMAGDLTYTPYSYDPYIHMVYNIIGQMLSISVTDIIFERLKSLCDGSISPETIEGLSNEQIKSIGISNAKVSYIRNLTDMVVSKELSFEQLSGLSDEAIVKQLTAIRGIGTWTAKMYLIFVLDRQDVLPYEDGTFLQVYRWLYNTKDTDPASIIKKCKCWKPYFSIAARYLYKAYDMGLTSEKFHLFK